MCAIAGMFDMDYSMPLIEDMLDSMKRRGPDAQGYYTDESCALLHSRLAVIDPQNGSQPMFMDWNDDKLCIVYNGELYNTAELRSELYILGHQFGTKTDTEVVLHAYAQWGREAVLKLNGIFAFAVLEIKNKRLFIARDRMGVKPLFYKLHQGGLIFSSEIKTILRYPTVKAQLDETGVAQLIMLAPGRMPGSGVFRDIYELEPGCCGYYQDHKWSWQRYWKLTDREHTDSFEETAEKVRYLVSDAILRQTVSDVPLGTFLSGGLDSSLISAICAKSFTDRNEELRTFSVDYENNKQHFRSGKFQPESDDSYIERMRLFINSKHSTTVLNPQQLLEGLYEAVNARDLPGMADVDSSLLVFCKEIRKDVTVALSGECADEIFGGYPWYRDPAVRSLDGFPWAQNTSFRASIANQDVLKHNYAHAFVADLYNQTIRESDILPNQEPVERRMKEMVNLNHRWFMQTLLDRKDRMSMYSALEVRVPFCDYRIAEYLYTVPWRYKDYADREKGLLRYAMRDYLPDQVLWRKKSPYPKTYDPRYLQLVTDAFHTILQDPYAPIFQIADKQALQDLLHYDPAWPWYGQLMKKPQTIAYMLMLNYWMQHYCVTVV